MVDSEHRSPVGTFHAPGEWSSRVHLPEQAVHHVHVKRLAAGDVVCLTSGDGRRALGPIISITRREVVVDLSSALVEEVEPPPRIELFIPVADRERMLWLAEKATELGLSSWRPVTYHRSRSVSPRGEGEAFRAKVIARQVSALEQSGGAWLPQVYPEIASDQSGLFKSVAEPGTNLVLDGTGTPIKDVFGHSEFPIRIALGPEGGLVDSERDAFREAGWTLVSLGRNVLRFETAAIGALAITRSHFPGHA